MQTSSRSARTPGFLYLLRMTLKLPSDTYPSLPATQAGQATVTLVTLHTLSSLYIHLQYPYAGRVSAISPRVPENSTRIRSHHPKRKPKRKQSWQPKRDFQPLSATPISGFLGGLALARVADWDQEPSVTSCTVARRASQACQAPSFIVKYIL